MPNHSHPMALSCGHWSADFEPDSGMLRRIRWQGREVLRGIYGAIRDRNWDTIPPVIGGLEVSTTEDRWTARFQAVCCLGDIDFKWKGLIELRDDARLVYRFEGQALATFLKNRIGLCVLHPIAECAGRKCQLRHTDGSLQTGEFPGQISPHQPFFRIRSLSHQVFEGLTATVSLEGDEFEMEDQRNWTDASFKTYSTPLELPFPVEIQRGDRVLQVARLSLSGVALNRPPGPVAPRHSEDVEFSSPSQWRPMPPIGLQMADSSVPLSARDVSLLKHLRLAHLYTELDLTRGSVPEQLEAALHQSRALGTGLDVGVIVGQDAERQLADLVEGVTCQSIPVDRWYIFHGCQKTTPEDCLALARRFLCDLRPQALFVVGTRAYFAELNRSRPVLSGADAICFSITPQVHASDDRSIIETLEAQPETIASARHFCGSLPIYVGPITLRPRFNPNRTTERQSTGAKAIPPSDDPRQSTLLAAGWTLGSFTQLASAGADRLTFYETVGLRGVMEGDHRAASSDGSPASPPSVFPVYLTLADIADFATGQCTRLSPANCCHLLGLVLRHRNRYRLLIANLDDQTHRIMVPSPQEFGAMAYRGRVLDENNREDATRDPDAFRCSWNCRVDDRRLRLAPWALACLDPIPGDAS